MGTRPRILFVAATAVLAFTLAPATLAGGGCHDGGTMPSIGSGPVIKIDGCTYVPTVHRVPVGTRVTWLNSSLTPHDVTGAYRAWWSRLLDVGDSFSHTFTLAGIYPYSCNLHPGMAGIIEVGPSGPATDPLSGTSDDRAGPAPAAPDGPDLAAPLAAGGFGLVFGALLVAALGRRRSGPTVP